MQFCLGDIIPILFCQASHNVFSPQCHTHLLISCMFFTFYIYVQARTPELQLLIVLASIKEKIDSFTAVSLYMRTADSICLPTAVSTEAKPVPAVQLWLPGLPTWSLNDFSRMTPPGSAPTLLISNKPPLTSDSC